MARVSTALKLAAGCALVCVGSGLVTTEPSAHSAAPRLVLRQNVPDNQKSPLVLPRVEKQVPVDRLRGGHAAPAKGAQGSGTPVELLICVSGIYFCYLYYGVLQEDLMTSKYGGKSFQEVCSLLFVVAMQCFIGAVFARISCALSPQPPTGWQVREDFTLSEIKNKLWPMYMQVGFCYVIAMLLSNFALFFINYPTQVIVKSCKMIPVMAVSVLVRGKTYPIAAYMRVAMVTIGIICFTFFKKAAKASKGARQNSIFGLSLALGSLLMDGFVGPTQEAIFSQYHSSTHQMMYYTNMWAMLLLTIVMVFTGDGSRAVGFVAQNPAVLSKILQFGLMSATGQFFIFFLVRSFSALTLVTVTTTRKFFTVLASVFWFKHRLTLGQWLSVAFVFSGLAWEEASKYIAKQKKRMQGVLEQVPPTIETVISAPDAKAEAVAAGAPANETSGASGNAQPPPPEAAASGEAAAQEATATPPAEGAEAPAEGASDATPPEHKPEGEAAPAQDAEAAA